ncbi:MAG: peptide chain release factor N(5)-glutamine methyltransferase [Sphingomonadales bacterium]
MTPRDALKKAAATLSAAGVSSSRLDAEILLAHALDISRERLLLAGDIMLIAHQVGKFEALIQRRQKREPVARITGVQEFWSLPFHVTRDTLIPRPDSETLVAAVLKMVPSDKPQHFLDLGTGTGCLLHSLLSELPKATGLATDFSTGALACARKNAEALNLTGRVEFKTFDWTRDAAIKGRKFDVVISNPPYIPKAGIGRLQPEVADYAPGRALDGGESGLIHYRAILARAPEFFGPQGGRIFLEVGDGQAVALTTLLAGVGFTNRQTWPDLAGIPRVVSAQKPVEKPPKKS